MQIVITADSLYLYSCRVLRKKQDPCTPDIRQVCSKRSWDGQIRKWRRLLHEYDPPKADDEEDPEMFDLARKQEVSSSPMDNSKSEVQLEADKFAEDVDLTIYNDWCDEES
jgi:histone RNA hairpin-binding protein